MKLNQHIALVGPRVVLVPYRSEHVEVYNEWMKDSELKELTASESLSLEEEYEMCKSWSNDSDKLTFIILERDLSFSDKENEIFHDSFRSAHLGNHRMIGDVNLFLSTVSPSFEDQKKEEDLERTRAEFEIMIASKVHRRKGYGLEVMKIFISYAHLTIPTQIDFDFVKISLTNQSSIHLFKKLGFQEFKINDYFQEIELRFDLFSPLNLQLSNDPLHRYCIPWPTKDITSDHQEINLVQFWILPWP